ncbi:MAG TPA: hypothetical protein VGZ00_12480 [Candidatus Baltobacteraceae bacterium]|jgi:hypothetical protein|nr:hypothetical protein [Candidatus Baltobacteraceae bacterium]
MSGRQFVLYFTKGLGDVALEEFREMFPTGTIIGDVESSRFFGVEIPEDVPTTAWERLRTVDDVRLLVAGPVEIRNEVEFADLCSAAALAVNRARSRDTRSSHERWSVTLSVRNPVWRQGETWDPAAVIAEHLKGATLDAKIRQPVDLRLQVDEDRVHIAMNLFAQPLGKCAETPSRHGALRPSVAASLIWLGMRGVTPQVLRDGLYDPFCGSGTIVAQAMRHGLRVFASDISDEAVRLTRERLARIKGAGDEADILHRVFTHDVKRGFPSRVRAGVIVSNLPWGKQIKIDRHQELFDAVAGFVERAIKNGGSCALLTTKEDRLIARIRRQLHDEDAQIESRRIGLLGQTPGIVIARAKI